MKWQSMKLGKRTALVCATLIVAAGTVLPGLTVNAADNTANSSSVSSASSSSKGSVPTTAKSKGTSQAKTTPKTAIITIKKYATVIRNNYPIWQSFSWDKEVSSANYSGKTVKATEYVKHSNGSKYYLLTTNAGKKIGYINADAVKVTDSASGAAIATNKYVTITKKGYTVWNDFGWKKSKHSTTNWYHHTFQVKYEYRHANGDLYYSLYRNGKWFVYLNATATKQGTGREGAAIATNSYVTITKKGYTVWNDFGFNKSKHSTTNWYHHTLQVKYTYFHANGGIYYSLYKNGKWFGYLSTKATTKAAGAKGIAFSLSESVKLKSGYTIWKNFSWNKQSKQYGSYKGQVLKVKRYYNHANGDTYYSIYTKSGSWVGYVNKNGVSKYVAPKQYTGAFWLKPSENKPYPNLKKYPNAYFSVSLAKQRVYVKAANGKTLYTMICSSGLYDWTPTGWYKIQAERGTAFSGANYWTSWLNHGQYLFHTVIVNHDRSYNVAAAKKLGHKASHGCIRLPVPDAIWIYKNAPVGMRVHIY